MGLRPSECALFEDTGAGVQAGKAAGCKVVGIRSPDILQQAVRVIAGLYELI
ncbi:HAD-IA family hydrolase [Paenibacillus woosongensis]|uniref:HAD-IA family hydrolase n=1 Tax=Paenibacillus woosongensis TaxID=307580 RepID=A0A7X2YZ01_9BACL|nr:HAD-IA family hydrolase [Paenibacillus woosongensis]